MSVENLCDTNDYLLTQCDICKGYPGMTVTLTQKQILLYGMPKSPSMLMI